jgi:hypothetical protein
MPTTLLDEHDSEILISSITPETALPQEPASSSWTRSCPLCNAALAKIYPWMAVVCQCGWQWKS